MKRNAFAIVLLFLLACVAIVYARDIDQDGNPAYPMPTETTVYYPAPAPTNTLVLTVAPVATVNPKKHKPTSTPPPPPVEETSVYKSGTIPTRTPAP